MTLDSQDMDLIPFDQAHIPDPQALLGWFNDLPTEEQRFVNMRLGKLSTLMMVEVDWDLLQCLIARWDPDYYTFRFGDFELLPTCEEMWHISGLMPRAGIIPLQRGHYFTIRCMGLLDVDSGTLRSLVNRHQEVDMAALFRLQHYPHAQGARPGQTAARAFILAFVGTLLFPTAPDTVNAQAVYLAEAIVDERAFIPNLVGEIIYGATELVTQSRQGVLRYRITFSPSLLQTWFLCHLGITAYTLNRRPQTDPIPIIVRNLPCNNRRSVINFFRVLDQPGWFYSKIPGFTPLRALLRGQNSLEIPILGITASSHYVPYRVQHQFGLAYAHYLVPAGLERPISLEFHPSFRLANDANILAIAEQWGSLGELLSPVFPANPRSEYLTSRVFLARRRMLAGDSSEDSGDDD